MVPEIDLRNQPEEEHRERLIDTLDGAESGDTFEITADRDIDPHLVRYQIEHNRELTWEYGDPDAEPRELHVTVGKPLDGDALATIDVRDLKPQRRHEVLLETVDELGVDEGFVLVNDHDPKPLYYELRSMHGDVIDWEYVSRGAGEWRVKIVKTDESAAANEDVITQFDVREIPNRERHPTIHHRYGMIPEGATIELIAPHEPRPLHREFRQQYGDSFTWEVVESEPSRCRVRLTKDGSVDGDVNEEPVAIEEKESASTAAGEEIESSEELDVRDLPPAQRHERIFDAYDALDPGEGFLLINDHDPKPLYHQFEAEAGPEFYWSYRQRESGEFRVLIGKAETAVPDEDTEGDEGMEAPF